MHTLQLPLLLKVSVGVIAVGLLAACATTKDEPAPQMAAAQSSPSPTTASASNATTSPLPPSAASLTDNLNDVPGDHVYFAYDKSDLTPEDMDALQKQAAWLMMHPAVRLVIEGHSDERGTREYNLALGARRASAVRAFLITNGINAARLETVSYGKERPVCVASAEGCWHDNRRAVSTVTSTP